MNVNQTQLALCLLVAWIGPAPSRLRGGDGLRGADTLDQRIPVMQRPVLPPVLTGTGELPAMPECHTGVTAPLPDCRCSREPFRAAPAADRIPFGASSRALFGAQVANGQAALMVLYRYDFLRDQPALAPAGWRKLARLAVRLAESPFPLIIEPSRAAPALDEARRRHVIQQLASLPFPVPAERVIVAPPPARGVMGAEAHSLYFKFLERMSGGGTTDGPAPALPYLSR